MIKTTFSYTLVVLTIYFFTKRMTNTVSSCLEHPQTISAHHSGIHPYHSDTHPNDVLSGKGNGAKNHKGNQHFRELVQLARECYISFPESKKILISKLVFDAIKTLDPPGRYLKKDDKDEWQELSEKEALAKTSQALREGQPGHKKSGSYTRIHESMLNTKLSEVKAKLEAKTKENNGKAIKISVAEPTDTLVFWKDGNQSETRSKSISGFPNFMRNISTFSQGTLGCIENLAMEEAMPPLPVVKDRHGPQSKSIIMSDVTVHTFEQNGDMSMHSRQSMYVDMQPLQSVDTCFRYKRDLSISSEHLGNWRHKKIAKTAHPDGAAVLWDKLDEGSSKGKPNQAINCPAPVQMLIRDSSHWSLDAEILSGTLLRETSQIS